MSDVPEPLKPHVFKPGESGNPGGRPKLPDDVRALKKERSHEYLRKFYYWCDATTNEVQKCEGAPWKTTTMDRMICSALIKAANGDTNAFFGCLDRLIGKPTEKIELTGEDGGPVSIEDRRSTLKELMSDPKGKQALSVLADLQAKGKASE